MPFLCLAICSVQLDAVSVKKAAEVHVRRRVGRRAASETCCGPRDGITSFA